MTTPSTAPKDGQSEYSRWQRSSTREIRLGHHACHLHGLAAFAAELQGLRELGSAVRAGLADRLASVRKSGGGTAAIRTQLQLDAIHFGHHAGQFLLQILLGLLVVFVGKLADAVLELQVAQVLVDSGLAFVQMLKGRNGLRFGEILEPARSG